jgi:hypothetical protein
MCLVAAPACTLDSRFLHGSLADAGFDSAGDAAFAHHADSGSTADENDAETPSDGGRKPVLDAGHCFHVDQFGDFDCSDTLTENSDYDRTIVGWKSMAGAELRWVDLDVQGSKDSGALAIKNAEQGDHDGTIGASAEQCLPAVAGKTYEYAASMYIQKGQTFGEAQIIVAFYEGANCDGIESVWSVSQIESTNKWLRGEGTLTVLPAARSMGVRLNVEKPYRSGTLEALFDAVRVTEVPASAP